MKLMIVPNPDQDIFKQITEKVIENGGYCPCALEKNEDTKCICKGFREQKGEGYCCCGRYMKKYK